VFRQRRRIDMFVTGILQLDRKLKAEVTAQSGSRSRGKKYRKGFGRKMEI
jgi:hypothetical protein